MDRHLPQDYNSPFTSFLQPILEQGQEGILESIRILLNEAMIIERSQALNANHYERSENRLGHANGFKPKGLQTRLGKLELRVPQTRDSSFYPSCLEKGLRSERALNCAMAEMYVQGVSTRKVTKVLEEMCGLEVSSSQVSRVTATLDEELEKWRNRPLGAISHMIVDARYEKVRVDRTVRDCALLIAYGVTPEGVRRVLGVSVALSEAEVHWCDFFKSLIKRGLHGAETITSDDHAGLGAARKSVLTGAKWQRCQFHLQQNASSHVPKKSMNDDVHGAIRNVFNAPDKNEALRLLNKSVEKYAEDAPDLSDWMAENIPEGLTVFDLPEAKRKKLRTTNMAEFQNKELKKRTRIIKVFPNKESLLRIASAILMELDEEWLSADKRYMKMEH